MIANLDAAQLEWRVIAHNSGDKTAIKEIIDGVDFHSDNQSKFKLPSRLIAKVFLFRAIFKGSAYAYSVDNDFKHIGGQKFWQNIIDKFYDKYSGIYDYHNVLMRQVITTGQIVSESGRVYKFEPRLKRGEMTWPENEIVNYPVQGFAADLMQLARISAWNRLKEQRESKKVLFVNTVHDSIKLDMNLNLKEAIEVGKIVRSSFQDIPLNFKKIYGKDLLVPMDADFKVGINDLWLHKINLT
ncbi:MAG: DNA polymerase I, thermostable [candidate division WS2 bacterium]|uniref:DNA-directed DNA polymerase n=1 Tax=Psychracetigena formicireducens TaxID=2986056 RepID=A0A9E2F1R3_PSYF1|nr:DNA polymerase I, thermostable [Candidatus Psychracetigena formicireducens]